MKLVEAVKEAIKDVKDGLVIVSFEILWAAVQTMSALGAYAKRALLFVRSLGRKKQEETTEPIEEELELNRKHQGWN